MTILQIAKLQIIRNIFSIRLMKSSFYEIFKKKEAIHHNFLFPRYTVLVTLPQRPETCNEPRDQFFRLLGIYLIID
jgi:hypothetical protein